MRTKIFRIIRVAVLLLALMAGAIWVHTNLTSLRSEQAVINAEIMQVRTPIEGVLEVGQVRPGLLLKKGDVLFKIVNPRFGDRESVSQYNSLTNLVESVRSDLLGAENARELADIDLAHATRLYSLKLIPRVEWEQATAKLDITKTLVAERRLLLTRSQKRAEEMEAQMQLQKESEVRMPADGLVWSINGKTGEQMEANKLVMEIINPSHIWVDAFLSEQRAKDLRTGMPASIHSLDSDMTWTGNLESIRAGVGRLSYDTTVAVPPPEMAKRQIAVRVEAKWTQPFTATEFFGIGRSVEVNFDRVRATPTIGEVLRDKCWNILARSKEPRLGQQEAQR